MSKTRILILSAVLIIGSYGLAGAVDLTGRFGFGFNNQTEARFASAGVSDSVTSLSLKYHNSPKTAFAVLFGVGYDSYDPEEGDGASASRVAIGGKFFYNIREEKQMNVYVGAGGIILRESHDEAIGDFGAATVSTFLFKIPGYIGGEFFLAGLPNLGISLETGIELILGSNTIDPEGGDEFDTGLFQFGTAGGIFNVGVHYYF